jgi:ABC-2 type transport system permease protein
MTRVVAGIATLAYGAKIAGMGFFEVVSNLPQYFFFLFLGLLVMYSLDIAINSISIWTNGISVFNFGLENIYQMGRFPVEIYNQIAIRSFFTFVIPLAVITNIPAKAFAGKLTFPETFLALMVASAFILISRKFFYFSLRHYRSASS